MKIIPTCQICNYLFCSPAGYGETEDDWDFGCTVFKDKWQGMLEGSNLRLIAERCPHFKTAQYETTTSI